MLINTQKAWMLHQDQLAVAVTSLSSAATSTSQYSKASIRREG